MPEQTREIETWINHGRYNSDGTARKHCPGCWNIVSAGLNDVRAVCNECGEERDIAALLDGE